MGTRGYRVYRYKRRFIVQYNQYDSYPEDFGIIVLNEIPPSNSSAEEFQRWLTETQQWFEEMFEKLEEAGSIGDYRIADKQPMNDLDIEWVYEIDLDHLVLHVDAQPLFRLDHRPTETWFLRGIGFDHYGHHAHSSRTPKEYRYNWTAPPPTPDGILLATYRNYALENQPVSIHSLTHIEEQLSKIEETNVVLLEKLIVHYMRELSSGHSIRELESIPSRDMIPEKVIELAYALVTLALYPKVFPRHEPVDVDVNSAFIWLNGIRGDICLRITTHLDDQANLQAAVGEIVDEVMKKETNMGMVHGIAFSIFHCVIISIDLEDGGKCRHTHALPFIPSWYANFSSTPGITALARFGNWLGFEMGLDLSGHVTVVNRAKSQAVMEAENTKFQIPREVCDHIVQHLYDPVDILGFGSVSPACQSAAAWILRHPHVDRLRLLSPVSHSSGNSTKEGNSARGKNNKGGKRNGHNESDDSEGSEQDEWEISTCDHGYPNLHLARFKAVTEGARCSWSSDTTIKMHLRWKKYTSPRLSPSHDTNTF